MQNPILKCSPKGRLLNMYLFDRKTTDYQGKPQPDETKHRFEAWVAIPKNDPGFAEYWGQVQAAAAQDWAQTQAHVNNPEFSWKISDGDMIKPDGTQRFNENCHGCWLLSYSSNFDVEIYNAQNQPITKLHNAVKAGDYVEIYGNFKGNGSDGKPGMFLNLNKVRVVGIGDPIISGPTAEQAFGAANQQAPAMQPPQQAPAMQPPQQAPAMQPPQQAPAMQPPQQAPAATGMPGATVAPATIPGGQPPSYTGYTEAPAMPNAPGQPNGLPGGDGVPY